MINTEIKKRILSSLFLIPITFFFIFQNNFFFIFFLSIIFLVSSYEWIKMNKKDLIKIVGIYYLFFAFSMAYFLRDKFSLGIFILILIICIFTDLGGYILGKIFKGPKLTKISPKKTYSGSLGGFVLSIISVIIYIKYTTIGEATYFNLLVLTNNNLVIDKMFFLFILFISLVSQIGDLIISYFKRLEKVKNTGKLLPGHGGLLDRIDGIIFAIPISYLLIIFLK